MYEILFAIAFVSIVVIGIAFHFYDRTRKNHLRELMISRDPKDDAAFSACWFSDTPRQADTAVRLRLILQENIKQSLDALTPDDRLEEDLYLELPRSPDLFYTIEEEFKIDTNVMDYAAHQEDLDKLQTFQDLVTYVEARRTD